MILKEFGSETITAVSVMRRDGSFGADPSELLDGNTIPRLCAAVGEEACRQACQLSGIERSEAGVLCAENNINDIINEFGVSSEYFLMVSATHDNVVFGDELSDFGVVLTPEGYSQLPASNAFFFRPGIDELPSGEQIEAMAMRMADCGSVNFRFKDSEGNLVLGQAHFSKPNMTGPSEFIHEIDGKKVSWGEFVAVNAMRHYGANPEDVEIYLSAAIDRENFVFEFDTLEIMRENFKGWEELGFVHPQEPDSGKAKFDCYIDYREMIDWQLNQATLAVGFNPDNINTAEAIDTGDIRLGHASHRLGSKGITAEGRDMYLLGRQVKET